MIKRWVLRLLVLYKKYVSRGENCRFVPSCSEYCYQAVEKYGVIKGLYLGGWRVMRCNPWTKGGVDRI